MHWPLWSEGDPHSGPNQTPLCDYKETWERMNAEHPLEVNLEWASSYTVLFYSSEYSKYFIQHIVFTQVSYV